MRNTTPKKIISLKPKTIPTPIDESKQLQPRRHIQKLYSPPPTSYLSPPSIHQPKYHPPRLSSPPIPNISQNVTMRPISMKGVQTVIPRPSISPTLDIHHRIPPLVFKKPDQIHSPRIVDSVVITKSQIHNKMSPTEVFQQKQIQKQINLIQKFPSQLNLNPKDSPRKSITISKLRQRELPVRYQIFKEIYQQKVSESLTNVPNIQIQQSKRLIQQKQSIYLNQTISSSSNKLNILTKKMEQIVKTNQNLQQKLQQISSILIQKDNQNKKGKKKLLQLTDKSKLLKKESQRLSDESTQYKSKIENEIDNVKTQYGMDLFKLQNQLKSLIGTRTNTENYISNLQKQQLEIETELYQLRELFKSIQNGFSQVNM